MKCGMARLASTVIRLSGQSGRHNLQVYTALAARRPTGEEAAVSPPATSSSAPSGTANEASGVSGSMGPLGMTKAPTAARRPPPYSPSTTWEEWGC